jgi:hypothetical protein
MRRLLAASLLLITSSACSGAPEATGAAAEPLAGQCPHQFELVRPEGVLTEVGVVDAYWGSWWTTAAGQAARAPIDAAWNALADDPRLYVALQAYAPAGKTIRGYHIASTVIGASLPVAPSLTKEVLEGEIARAIAAGSLPSRGNGIVPIHVVHLPPGMGGPVLEAPGGPVDYAAYHDAMTLPSGVQVPYVVALYDVSELRDIAESHELFETITNGFDDGWRDEYLDGDSQHEEIADVCQGIETMLDGHVVQELWSPAACGCVPPQGR